jgi:hypothetical protein
MPLFFAFAIAFQTGKDKCCSLCLRDSVVKSLPRIYELDTSLR